MSDNTKPLRDFRPKAQANRTRPVFRDQSEGHKTKAVLAAIEQGGVPGVRPGVSFTTICTNLKKKFRFITKDRESVYPILSRLEANNQIEAHGPFQFRGTEYYTFTIAGES